MCMVGSMAHVWSHALTNSGSSLDFHLAVSLYLYLFPCSSFLSWNPSDLGSFRLGSGHRGVLVEAAVGGLWVAGSVLPLHHDVVAAKRAPIGRPPHVGHLQLALQPEPSAKEQGAEAKQAGQGVDDARAQPSSLQDQGHEDGSETAEGGHADVVGDAHAGVPHFDREVLNGKMIDQTSHAGGEPGVADAKGQDADHDVGGVRAQEDPKRQARHGDAAHTHQNDEAEAVDIRQPADGHGQGKVHEAGHGIHDHSVSRSHAGLREVVLDPDATTIGHYCVGGDDANGHQDVGPVVHEEALYSCAGSFLRLLFSLLLLALQEVGTLGNVPTTHDGDSSRDDGQDERDPPAPCLHASRSQSGLHHVCDKLRSQETGSSSDVHQGDTTAQNLLRCNFS
mmetsp:Transcript_42590/g.64381  ORF Transcript_42590/g.64381 Transcript_42590/m.64381 type:complete len:393 (+) Transcript_42590:357-1535(+)